MAALLANMVDAELEHARHARAFQDSAMDKQFKKLQFLYHPDRAKFHEDQGTGLTADDCNKVFQFLQQHKDMFLAFDGRVSNASFQPD